MADYSEEIALAQELLDEFGMPMTYVSITEDTTGMIDPETGKYPVTIERSPFVGVKTQPTAQEVQAGRFQNVSLVVLAPGDAVAEADTTDVLQFDGRDWDVTEVRPVAPAEQVILYKLGVQDAGSLGTGERIARAAGARHENSGRLCGRE